MAEMGFEPGMIAEITRLPRGTVTDIIRGNGPWRDTPQNELVETTRLRVRAAIENAAYDLAMKALARLEDKFNKASFWELISACDVLARIGWR